MWATLSGVVSSAISAVSSVAEALAENPRAVAYGVAAFLLFTGGGYAGYWFRGVQEPRADPTEIRHSNTPLDSTDFLAGSTPALAELFPAPDSARIETVRVRVPKYITRADTVYRDLPEPMPPEGIASRGASLNLRARLQSNPYGFLLLPTPGGRPSVYVSESETEVRAVDPRDASSVRLRYPHPTDRFQFGPLVRASGTFTEGLTPEAVVPEAILGGWGRYRGLRFGAGYRFAPPARSGPTLSIEWSPTLF